MTVYVVLYNCGDYYCGCPGGATGEALHIAGVFASREVADEEVKRFGHDGLVFEVKVQ